MSSKAASPVVKMLRREEREVEVQEGKETPGIKDMGILLHTEQKKIDPPKYHYWACKRLKRPLTWRIWRFECFCHVCHFKKLL